MQKFDIVLPQGEWGSTKTKYPPDSDQVNLNNFVEGTINVETDIKGVLTKIAGGVQYNPVELAIAPKDQYEAIFEDGSHHLLAVQSGEVKYSSGDGIFNTVVNGAGFTTGANFQFATILNRVYGCNNINAPQVYDRVTSYGGVGYSAPQMKVMGCQVPSSPPTAAMVAGAGVPVGGHTYKVTYLYYGSQESNGSATSNLVTVAAGPNQQVDLSSVPIGGYGVTSRKIYRDKNDGVYLQVGQISDNTTTVFSDNATIGTFPMPTANNLPPTFQEILSFLDRAWLTVIPGSPYTVRFSDPGLPDIHPAGNTVRCNQEDPVVAFKVFKGKIIVLNRNSIGQILGRSKIQFRYEEIPDSVGCVDSRSVQVRTVQGIPLLIWLSDKGFYGYNGNSVSYISDDIENIVNFNIQQSQFTKGINSQTTQSDFQSGTPSDGIDLTTLPGSITTPNPVREWNDQLDWEGGDSLENIATRDLSNRMESIVKFSPIANLGIAAGDAVIESGAVSLNDVTDYTGRNLPIDNNYVTSGGPLLFGGVATAWAQKINFAHNGAIQNTKFYSIRNGNPILPHLGWDIKCHIYSDISGNPSAPLWSSSLINIPWNVADVLQSHSFSPNLSISSGDYWFVVEIVTGGFAVSAARFTNGGYSEFTNLKALSSGVWTLPADMPTSFGLDLGEIIEGPNTGSFPTALPIDFTFAQDNQTSSGQWQTAIYDTQSISNVPPDIQVTAQDIGSSGVGNQTISLNVQVSDTGEASSFSSAETFVLANGTQVLNSVTSDKRYWRLLLILGSTDNRFVPAVDIEAGGSPLELRFPDDSIWISEPINCTGDVTSYDSLDIVDDIPSGTSVTVEVRTATTEGGLGAAPWVNFGSAVVRQWFQVRITMTLNTANTVTASVTSLKFTYTIVANIQSSSIDTGVTPAGWDIFQSSFTLNGGTLVYEMRSGVSLPALAGASYVAVTVNAFPAVPPNQYVQWRTTFTSTENNVPIVSDVTVNWFIAAADSIRVASLFHDRRYFISVAEFGQTTNNLLIELDSDGKWRLHRGFVINTFSLFFNQPYYGHATSGKIVRFLQGTSNLGAPIEFDIRTKTLQIMPNSKDDNLTKIIKNVTLTGASTGATYQVSFSVNEGDTWKVMRTDTGLTSFICPTAGPRWEQKFVANYAIGQLVSGKTLMIRVYNNDEQEVQIHKIRIKGYIRQSNTTITG